METTDISMLKDQIAVHLEKGDFYSLNELLEESYAPDIAEALMDCDMDIRLEFFKNTNRELASEVLLEMDEATKNRVLELLDETIVGEMVSTMDSDDAADILSEMDDEDQSNVLDQLTDEDSDAIEELLAYEDASAGHLMQKEFIMVPETVSVEMVIEGLKEVEDTISHWSDIYLVDRSGKLTAICPIQHLLLSDHEELISHLAVQEPIYATTEMDQEEIAKIFRRYDLLSMPVVDKDMHILGMITVDDVIDVIYEEHEEDSLRMAGVGEGQSTYSTFGESIFKRLPWLGLALLTASIACSIIGFFEKTIEQMALIAVFLPIVAALGGNAGSQTVTVIVRALAMNHIKAGRVLRVILKELGIGLINGVVIGILGGTISFLFLGTNYLFLCIIFILALWANITVATFLGTVIPILLKQFRMDPAYSSIIFLTLFTDGVGFFVFLSLTQLLLIH